MSTKHTDSCLLKAGDDEPIFVLRSTDRLAPEVVRNWAIVASLHGCHDSKVNEALALADKMEDWAKEHGSKFPD